MANSKTWIALLLLGLSAAAGHAEPVSEDYVIESSDAIVIGRLSNLIAVPGLTSARGISLLRVEKALAGPLHAGDWFLLPWTFPYFNRVACPPAFDPRGADGSLVLWFIDLDESGKPRGLPQGWSLESVQGLEQHRDFLEFSHPLSERMALVEEIVLRRLEELSSER
jgi:hypothetical protein